MIYNRDLENTLSPVALNPCVITKKQFISTFTNMANFYIMIPREFRKIINRKTNWICDWLILNIS